MRDAERELTRVRGELRIANARLELAECNARLAAELSALRSEVRACADAMLGDLSGRVAIVERDLAELRRRTPR